MQKPTIMRQILQTLVILLTLSISSLNAQTYNAYYNTVVSNVSSSNILTDLTAFENFGVKDVGSTALGNAQNWIKTRYQNLGYTNIVEQPFSYGGNTTNNIIITKTGSVYPNTYLIIDAHYDTINGTGTNDNGSGTVLIMELARLLKNVNTEYSIKFIHFSGEEDGLIGSNYYVNNTVIPDNLDISLVFNIDEVGGVNGLINNTIVCENDQDNTPSSNNAASAASTTIMANCFGFYSNLNTEISYAYSSDYVPFENNGEIITGLYEKNETPHAHTSSDTLANMDVNYLFEVTKGALGTALEFAVALNTLDVTTFNSKSDISFYPNPSTGKFNIKLKDSITENLEIVVLDVLGKIVYKAKINSQTETIDLSFLNSGIYLATLKNDKTRVTKKIVIQ
ncbi:leucyl aminopeptidase [Lacinutrix sp. Bg11-31]|nr:leucyl aminopeptidase [Lacinutrix sp. Bg11-31]